MKLNCIHLRKPDCCSRGKNILCFETDVFDENTSFWISASKVYIKINFQLSRIHVHSFLIFNHS
jgi:hypothetical protein